MGDYDQLFYVFPKVITNMGSMLPLVEANFCGEFCIPGAQIQVPYRAYVETGIIDAAPHFHRDEEYLAYVGYDLRNAFESFDAEIEMWMGEDIGNMEKIVINEPTMIRVPPFYWHGPIEIKKLGKPLFFQPILFNSRYYAIKHRIDMNGNIYYEAE